MTSMNFNEVIFRHVKVFDLLNYDIVHTMDYPSPILSLGVLVWFFLLYFHFNEISLKINSKFKPQDESIYVGMSDGLLSIKERKKPEDFIMSQRKQQKSEKFNPYRYASPNFVNSSVRNI